MLIIFVSFFFVDVGHSLGAGTSVLLAFMLRPKYPDVRVYAFATPGKCAFFVFFKIFLGLIMLEVDLIPVET